MPELEHSCGPDCPCHPTLKPGQFETIIATYGYAYQGILMSRQAAEKIAKQLEGATVGDTLQGLLGDQLRSNGYIPVSLNKVVSIRLEDDSPADPTKGRVIAVCEPLTDSRKPYKPEMEMK